MSVPSAWNNLPPTGQIFMRVDIWVLFYNVLRKFKCHWNLTKITSTFHVDQYTLMITSGSVLLRMRNVSDKSCRENQNTPLMFNTFSFLKSFRLWYNAEKYGKSGQATDENTTHTLNSFPSWHYSKAVYKPVWHIPLLCVQWKTPDDGQRNCPKHVEFLSKINLRN
jgi:hypothetical protein